MFAALSGWFAATPVANAQAPVVTNPKDLHYLDINEAFNPNSNTWAPRAAMPTARSHFATSEANGLIYVMGGEVFNNCTPVPTVEAYNPASDSWATRAPMPPPYRWFTGAGTVNGIIYVVGGALGCGNVVNTVAAYDPSSGPIGQWLPRQAMNAGPRQGVGIAVIHDDLLNRDVLYAIGGSAPGPANPPVDTVEKYDPLTDTWTTMQPMNTARRFPNVAAAGGKIYAIGGYDNVQGLNSVEEYDPLANAWTTKASVLPTPRTSPAGVAVLNGKIYIVGGGAPPPNSILATVEAYDPSNDTWTTKPPLPTGRNAPGAAVINNILYTVGGESGGAAAVGQQFILQITATNHPTNYGASGLPSGLNVDPARGIIFGVPTNSIDAQVTLTAGNGSGTGAQQVRLYVQPPPPPGPLIISSTCATGRAGQPFSFQVLTRNVSSAARFTAGGLPYKEGVGPGTGPQLTIDPVTGRISGTVPPDPGGSPKTFAVHLGVTDGPATATATLQLTFISESTVPIITSASNAILRPGQFFSYTITAAASANFNYIGSDGQEGGTLPPGLTFDAGTHTISGVYSGGGNQNGASRTNRRAAAARPANASPDTVKKEPPVRTVEPIGSNSDGSGVGPLNFFEETTFASWAPVYFTAAQLADPSISGDSADPDLDDLSNLLEYALNLDPTEASATNRPYAVLNSTYLSLIYTKVLGATDLIYAIEESTDLALWLPAAPVNQVLTDDGFTQTIKAQVPRSDAGSAGKLYLRLRVSH